MFDPLEGHNFDGDGCTFSPDRWRGVDLTGCCSAHDDSWSAAREVASTLLGYLRDMLGGNADLLACATQAGAADWGVMALFGTSLFAVYVAIMRKLNGVEHDANRS